MAQSDPTQYEYLAVVSEWSSQTRNGGLVGNAFPLFNLTRRVGVENPEDEFYNPGAIFLPSRGSLNNWDFVRVRLRNNFTYKDAGERDCGFIASGFPDLLEHPEDMDSVAVILDHPTFDPTANSRQILNPAHGVTPLFFVKKADAYYGPLVRDAIQRTVSYDMQRIDWRTPGDDGVVYQFTVEQLAGADIRICRYQHPVPTRNRVIEQPISMFVGKIRDARSPRAHDSLPLAGVIEWYLKRAPKVSVPLETINALRGAFHDESPISESVKNERLRKVEKEFATHTAFADQRDRFAKTYLDSEIGQQRIRDLIDDAVKKKASEIRAEADKLQEDIAKRRNELTSELAAVDAEHQQKLFALRTERDGVAAKVDELTVASADLQRTLAADAASLAVKMRDQIPLIAALAGGSFGGGVRSDAPVGVTNIHAAAPVVHRADFRPIPPSKPLAPVSDERKLVENLRADLARQGLRFAGDFVANVYICLKAESLNLIIGPPGYGKSMLVTAMARSLGHQDAFLPITVRRSWAEDRHLLGFFDTFNNRYDPGPTRLVPRMLQAAADWEKVKKGIYIVLLDEFNLAAPEYYFAQLLQVLPSDDARREVALYDPTGVPATGFPDRVSLGPNLRFWGTINYDETTERLSPRTLDRTGMIFLGDSDVRPASDEDSPPMSGVSGQDLFAKYRREHSDCPDDRWELVSSVIDVLRGTDVGLGPKVELSPRVQNGIRRYLANSVGVLDPKTATDFVVQQRLLPVVRGRGDEFVSRIRRLAELLAKQNLNRSARHVEDALRRSESQFGEVDFLSY